MMNISEYGTRNAMETLLLDRAGAATATVLPQLAALHVQRQVELRADPEAHAEHTNRYWSHHTDAIVTEDYSDALRFLHDVDSASVTLNALTRFVNDFEYGLGAEIGISDDKLHACDPIGLEGLTSLKYAVFGRGEVRG